jgi:hypothetical protein
VAAMINMWLKQKNSSDWSISMSGISGGKVLSTSCYFFRRLDDSLVSSFGH